MVKPLLLIIGTIPLILAILIAIPMITKPDIPTSAVVPEDIIELEFTKHQLKKISFGVTETIESIKTEILLIKDDGSIRYSVIENGILKPDQVSSIDQDQLRKLKATIKETGFMAIPSELFPVDEDVDEYLKSSLRVTLNDQTIQIHWPEQNATQSFVPPIITLVESELNQIINQFN